MKYIDADRLRARIEKYLTFDNNIDTAFYIGRRDAERNILALIDSLQQDQPEVELDKVAEGVVLKLHPIMSECYTMNLGMHEMIKLVKSGFELGLNAGKEENK